MNPDWLRPDWPAPAHVRAVCTTRAGGVSTGAYASLNLGDHVGDAPQAVAANRRILGEALVSRPVFLQQVHGRQVLALDRGTPDGTQADGCVAMQPGVACTIMVADCLPVLFTNARGTAVAAAHAGWRGLADGVLAAVHERFEALGQTGPAAAAMNTIAWLGPCIGPRAFEVGAEVKAAFEARDPQSAGLFRPHPQRHAQGKWLADLAGLARRQLHALGITRIHGNDGSDPWCTVSQASRFFSHRRDRVSGRFAACVWLQA